MEQYAKGYELLAGQINLHVKNHIDPGFSEPNYVFSNVLPPVIEIEARELFQDFIAGSLDDYLSKGNVRFAAEGRWHIRSAIKDFFEREFYKNAVGFETSESKNYDCINDLQEDISARQSLTLRMDNCNLLSTEESDTCTVEKCEEISLIAKIRETSSASVDLDFFHQDSYDLSGKLKEDINYPPHIFAQLRLTDNNVRQYQIEVLPF